MSLFLFQANKATIWQVEPAYPARMTQVGETPPYADLLAAVGPELDSIVAEVVRDVAGPDDDLEALGVSSRATVESTIAALVRAEELSGAELSSLRLAGSRAAREGEPLKSASRSVPLVGVGPVGGGHAPVHGDPGRDRSAWHGPPEGRRLGRGRPWRGLR